MAVVGAHRRIIHPVHAVLLAATLPLFLGTLLSDWAYSSTELVQWTHFASWLNAGALVLAGLALAWALIDYVRADVARDRKSTVYLVVLAATLLVGFVNALVHAKDAWAAMPAALVLSVVVLVLALAATAIGFSTLRGGASR